MTKIARRWIFRALAMAVGAAMIYGMIRHVGFQRFGKILAGASTQWLLAAVCIYALSWFFRTWRMHSLAAPAGLRMNFWQVFRIHIAGYALNAVLPVKMGDVATMVYLRRDGIRIGRAAAIVVQTRVLDMLGLVLLFIPTFALALNQRFPSWILPTYLICASLVLVPIGVVTIDRYQRIAGFFKAIESYLKNRILRTILSKAADAYTAYHEIATDRKLLAFTISLSVAIWLMDVLTCMAVSLAFGGKVSLLVVIIAVAIGNIGKSAPATPGGVGVYEGLVAGTMAFMGFPFDIAVVIAIVDHLIKKAFNLVLGLPMAAGIGISRAEVRSWMENKPHPVATPQAALR